MDEPHSFLIRLLMDDRFRAWVNQPTPDRERYWQQRLAAYPEERAVVEQARQLLQNLDFNKSQRIDRAGILNRALHQAHTTAPVAAHRRFSGYGAAAVLLGFALIVGYWYFLPRTETYATAYGESQRIVLPDSSIVVLNANSTLRFPSDWNDNTPRRVELRGEAFFSVTHQANQQKFIVSANDLAIEVLGTEFNVNHRRGETEVVLERGSIRLDWSSAEPALSAGSDTRRSLLVQPGELVRFSEAERQLTKRVVNPRVYSAWKEQRWVFEQTPLSEVFTMIEDNYGCRVVVEQAAIADRLFTAEMQSADIDLLLTFLSESFALTITREESRILIREKGTITK